MKSKLNEVKVTFPKSEILKFTEGLLKDKQVRCCICNHLYDRNAFGSLEENGRGRRFCPDCSRDILYTNRIHEDQCPPDEY
jgi:hypothetical protein